MSGVRWSSPPLDCPLSLWRCTVLAAARLRCLESRKRGCRPRSQPARRSAPCRSATPHSRRDEPSIRAAVACTHDRHRAGGLVNPAPADPNRADGSMGNTTSQKRGLLQAPAKATSAAAAPVHPSSLSRLAVVELQTIMQFCPTLLLLRLASTSHAMRRAADAAHVWDHRTSTQVVEDGCPLSGDDDTRVLAFTPAMFSPHAILLRRHPQVGNFVHFRSMRDDIPYEQLHLVDLRLVRERGQNPPVDLPERQRMLRSVLQRPDAASNWRLRTLLTNMRLETENNMLLSHPLVLRTLHAVWLHADSQVHDDIRVPRMLSETLLPMAGLRALWLDAHHTLTLPTLSILASFEQLTALRLGNLSSDLVLAFLTLPASTNQRGGPTPLFAKLEALELFWIVPPTAEADEETNRRRQEVTDLLQDSGGSALSHFTSLTHLALDGTLLSPLLLPQLRGVKQLRQLHYREETSYATNWGDPNPPRPLLSRTLEDNPQLAVFFQCSFRQHQKDAGEQGKTVVVYYPPRELAVYADMNHPRVHVVEKLPALWASFLQATRRT
jgi:hypothetical protein